MILSLLSAFVLSPVALAQDAAPAEDAPAEEAPASAPVTYTLKPEVNDLYVLVKYDRNSTLAKLGHDHVVTPTTFTGTVTWDAQDVSACNVQISFPVSALVVDPAGARSMAGLEGDTSDGDKGKIKDNFSGKNQLDAGSFPTISFASTSCSGSGSSATVNGKLTIHGVGKSVSVPMTVNADGSSFSAKGQFTATHSDFGFDPFSAILGQLKNDNTLTFVINVEGSAS